MKLEEYLIFEDTRYDDEEMTRNECEDKLEKERINIEDVPYGIWKETLNFINIEVPRIICMPKHMSTKTELSYLFDK